MRSAQLVCELLPFEVRLPLSDVHWHSARDGQAQPSRNQMRVRGEPCSPTPTRPKGLAWATFTQMTPAPNEVGGIANAIYGSVAANLS